MLEPTSIDKRQKAVQVITNTFMANPSVNIVIGDGGNKKRKIKRLADYAFVKAYNRNGAWLSSNEKGAALFFRSDAGKANLKEIYYELRFAFSIPPSKVIAALQRENYIKQHRSPNPHLYFWFLGVEKGGNKAVYELKNSAFAIAKKEGLPILLETSVMRNVIAYERYGFKTYHTWKDQKNGISLWFMRWEP